MAFWAGADFKRVNSMVGMFGLQVERRKGLYLANAGLT
jgi:hypothetical protein